jgi:hypothetical protein
MRESLMYGSVRGALGNSRPYRDRRELIAVIELPWETSPLTIRSAGAQSWLGLWRIGLPFRYLSQSVMSAL